MNRVAIHLTAAAVMLCAASIAAGAQTLDLPARKPGLWDMKTVTEAPPGLPALSTQMCIDAATDKEVMNFGLKLSRDNCKRYDIRRAGKAWVINADCNFGPVRSSTKTTVSGDFQSSIELRIEGTADGVPGTKGPQATVITQTAKWVSACTNGMKPGDMVLPGGLRVNVKQVRELQRMLPNLQIR
jgi:hypothetical protein